MGNEHIPSLEELADMVIMDLSQHINYKDLKDEDRDKLYSALNGLAEVTTEIMEQYYFS